MLRRVFLRRLVLVVAGLATGEAIADPVDDILEEINSQGFKIVRVQRTWLGRVRIIGQNASFRREVVIDPTTGEIRRDLLSPRNRSPGTGSGGPEEPDLGSSRGIRTIENDTGGAANSPATGAGESGEDSGGGWGGGWGSKGGQSESDGGGGGNPNGNASDNGTAADSGDGSGNGDGNGNGKGGGEGNGKGGGNGKGAGSGKGGGEGNGKGGGKDSGKGNDKGNGGRSSK